MDDQVMDDASVDANGPVRFAEFDQVSDLSSLADLARPCSAITLARRRKPVPQLV